MQEQLVILKDILGSYNVDGREYLFRCPKCNHHKNKLSINLEKDVWKCWICEYSGRRLRKLVKQYGSTSHVIRWDNYSEENQQIQDIKELFNKKVQVKSSTTVKLPDEYKFILSDKTSKEGKKAYKYLIERGLSDLEILMWKIGYCDSGDYSGRIIVPSFDLHGDLNYFIARAYFKAEGDNRYKNSKANKDELIFNDLNVDWNKPIVLVEGVFDAIKAENAIPILGSSVDHNSLLFQKLVLADVPVYVALDADAEKKSNKIITALNKYDVEVFKINTTEIDDIGSISHKEFQVLFSEAKKVTSLDILKNKIRAA